MSKDIGFIYLSIHNWKEHDVLTKKQKTKSRYFLTLICLLMARPAYSDLIDAKEFVSEEDTTFLEQFQSSGKNWHGIIKKKFTNPNKSVSDIISISFPTSTYYVDYASEFVEWENKPDDVIIDPVRIASAERLMSRGVYKIADFSDLLDVIGLGYATESGFTEAEILPSRKLSIQIDVNNFRKLLARGYTTTLSEVSAAATLFGVGDLEAAHLEELIKAYELKSIEVFEEMTALGRGENCYHTFNYVSFTQAGYSEISGIGTVSGCVIGGLNIAISNVKYSNDIPSARYVIETAYALSQQTESYVNSIEVNYE